MAIPFKKQKLFIFLKLQIHICNVTKLSTFLYKG